MNLTIPTSQKRQVVDITDAIEQRVRLQHGIAVVFVAHTTAAVTTADLDPGTDLDFLDFLQAITPNIKWRHPHDPQHAPDHILSTLIGPSECIPVISGKLALGTWQRVVLIELDGPRQRDLIVQFLPE